MTSLCLCGRSRRSREGGFGCCRNRIWGFKEKEGKKKRKKNGRKLKKKEENEESLKKMKGGWCGLCSNRNDREEINNKSESASRRVYSSADSRPWWIV